tara:strand:+ start:1696 stop:3579 length:1884 start_codon:yes stop_codon:yes gene_type:complete
MIDGYEKHTCTECETMFTSNEELQQHHTIDHGLIIENSIQWTDVQPEDKVEETDNGFISNGKKITFSDEDKSIAESYLTETAKLQRVMVASEQRLKLARDEIKASEAETNAFYEQFLGESNGQDFSSGAGTIKPLDTPKFKYSKNKKLADTINTKGYNPNPNAGLYDNKQFKEGGDHLEDPLAKEDFEVSFYSGESRASEYTLEDLADIGNVWDNSSIQERKKIIINTHNGYTDGHDDNIVKNWNELGDYVKSNIAQDWNNALKPFDDDRKSFFGLESRASEGSKASIYDTKEDHNEDSAWNLHSWDIDTGNGMRCGVCGIFEMYNGYNRKPTGESIASELGIGSTFNMSGSASDVGEQEFWCRHIGTGGIKCGEPFPEHFNGNIEDHDFYPIAQSTQDQMDGKLNESKASEREEWETGSDWNRDTKGNPIGTKYDEEGNVISNEFGDYEVKCDCDKDPDCKTCGGKGTNTWTSTVGKSSTDESLKADWDDSDYEEKYSWLKDLGVEDAFKYANMTLYELPEPVWKIVNEDYVKGFKQMTNESYQPDQKDVVETSEEKIISRKLGNVPVGQIARELVLWDNMSAEEAEKMVSETEPNDNDITAQSLFNKKYSELNNNELAEMELYDV